MFKLNPVIEKFDQLESKKKQQSIANIAIFIIIVSIVSITLCAQSSPLSPFNSWVDSNIYMTIGKSMWDGKVPYKDLYDQKGPFIFAVHALGSLISRTNFLGVWIIEIIYAFFFLFYSVKSIALFRGRYSYYWAPLLAISTYTVSSFACGDSAEELALPFLAYATWVGLDSLYYNKYPSTKQLIIVGITSGCVFWTKYSLTGLYVGWFISLVIFLPNENKLKKVLSMIFKIIIGVFISTLPWIIYFGLNHAIKDLLTAYFYNNIFYYRYERTVNILLHYLIHFGLNIQNFVENNISAFLLLIIGLIYFIKKKNKKIITYFILCFLFCYLLTYAARRHPYSPLVFSSFAIYGLICIDSLVFSKIQPRIKKKKVWNIICIIFFIILTLLFSNNTHMFRTNKEDLAQYKFKKIIDQTPDANVLMYQTLDTGIYTVCDLVPAYKYYFRPNLDMKEIDDSQLDYLFRGDCDYVVVKVTNYDRNKEKYDKIFADLNSAGYKLVLEERYSQGNYDQLYSLSSS